MAQISRKLRSMTIAGGFGIGWYCPGCEHLHAVPLVGTQENGHGPWRWDQSLEAPSISPSVNIEDGGCTPVVPGNKRCHSIITAGRIQFCSDCGHALVGQTVDMPDLPAWLSDDKGEQP
jgi:hypothetical protein